MVLFCSYSSIFSLIQCFFAFKMITVRCLFATNILQFPSPWNVQRQLLSCLVIKVISSTIIINIPNDLVAHAKPIYTLIVFNCRTYGIQSSHKCYTELFFVRLLVCLTRVSTASLMLLYLNHFHICNSMCVHSLHCVILVMVSSLPDSIQVCV